MMNEQDRQHFLAIATEESVLAEVKDVLTFARDYFKMRGRTILATNIECQLGYFNSAKEFDYLDEQNIVPVSADNPA
jgi:hypothetical protein